ncbi:MAG: transporter substrate-binding domain-containing protein [Clostridiales Family XIII bacterium]|jgi:ABC-type amino acid transport substrate-binding protein|nr:transporter substrate-binding domain-containing protein [Clostridiales Family XIII bacterium]
MMGKRRFFAILLAIALAALLAGCGQTDAGSGSAGGGSEGQSGASAAADEDGVDVIASPGDFPGRVIAVQRASTAAKSLDDMIAEGAEGIEVQAYEAITEAFDDLAAGKVDAIYVDSVVSAYYTDIGTAYLRTWMSQDQEPMGVCVAKGAEPLAEAIDAAIDKMFYNGSMSEIAVKNFGDDFTEGLRNVGEEPAIPDDFETIEEGVLTVGLHTGYPPMEYEEGGMTVGFDVDLAEHVAALLGLEVAIVDTGWDEIFDGLAAGRYDCIMSAVSITDELKQEFIMTEPYMANRLCIVVKN